MIAKGASSLLKAGWRMQTAGLVHLKRPFFIYRSAPECIRVKRQCSGLLGDFWAPFSSDGPCKVPLLLWCFRDRVPPSLRVWRMPPAHLRPLPDESQRLVMARGVFAVHRVSAAPHHQLLLQRKETLLQTRLPTVSFSLRFFKWVCWCAVIKSGHCGGFWLSLEHLNKSSS